MVTESTSMPGKQFLKRSILKTVGIEIIADSITVVELVPKKLLLSGSDESSGVHLKNSSRWL